MLLDSLDIIDVSLTLPFSGANTSLTHACMHAPPRFRSKYVPMVQDKVMPRFGAVWHWAKLEPRAEGGGMAAIRKRLAARFPIKQFNSYRTLLDPKNVLSNDWLDQVLPR